MSTQENQIEKSQPLIQIKSRKVQTEETDARITQYHELRDKVAAKRGKEFWRSLEELSDTPEFREYLQHEFPEQASEFTDPVGRRKFIKLMGASLALAGFGTACAYQPRETMVMYNEVSEEQVPGKALFFATAMPRSGIGLLVRSNEGRPTKIEGNPDHPASLGATDIYAQAAILQLYDPDRSQTILERGEASSWQRFMAAIRETMNAARERRGAGIRFLTETVTSPTLARQIRELQAEIPDARFIQYEPTGGDNKRLGAVQALGQPFNTVYRFEAATRVLSIDSDFLAAQGSADLRYSRDFMRGRSVEGGRTDINRLYAVECTPTQTGAKADHRLPLRPSELEPFARTVAAALGAGGAAGTGATYTGNAGWVAAMVRDLQANRGRSIVIVGDEQPPAVHALGHLMNAALGNVGTTVFYTEPVEFFPSNQVEDLRQLVADMNAGTVNAIIIVGGNPVYNAPADFDFAGALDRVPFRAHLSMFVDETSELCHWHVPESHFLEAWSDARAYDGTVSIVQPLINPLYDSRSAHEFIGSLSETPNFDGYNIVRETYTRARGQRSQATVGAADEREGARETRGNVSGEEGKSTESAQSSQDSRSQGGSQGSPEGANGSQSTSGSQTGGQGTQGSQSGGGGNRGALGTINARVGQSSGGSGGGAVSFDKEWRRILHNGVVPNTAFQLRTVSLAGAFTQGTPVDQPAPIASSGGGESDTYEIVFRKDPTLHDGRYANNGWLQELPKPITKITWDNAALVNQATARRLGVSTDFNYKGGGNEVDVVKLSYNGAEVEAPIWIVPGQPDNTVTVHFGHGRKRVGRVGEDVGFNAYRIRPSTTPYQGVGLRVDKVGRSAQIATTQLHYLTEDREPVRVNTIGNFVANPKTAFASHEPDPPADMTMYPQYKYDFYKWGMAIDLNSCVGCNACVVACQSENNIPVVGKEQVTRSREMHWIRIDAYYRGESTPHEGDIAEERALDNPEGPYFQPLMCVHCEQAPCEPVCPVHATIHDAEGLNVQIYNRCIGTRYCSNNCPYKVRRFNFLLYQDWETPQYKLVRNPEVSIRSRGVMEKCTYCTQRIQYGKIEASKEGRRVRDGEVVTACAAVCPTEAIVFGDLNDPEARVTKLRASTERGYRLLGELNTRPRTEYLGALRNPNPEIEPPSEQEHKYHNSPNTSSQEQNGAPTNEAPHNEGTH